MREHSDTTSKEGRRKWLSEKQSNSNSGDRRRGARKTDERQSEAVQCAEPAPAEARLRETKYQAAKVDRRGKDGWAAQPRLQ